jgi:hypothetical protein
MSQSFVKPEPTCEKLMYERRLAAAPVAAKIVDMMREHNVTHQDILYQFNHKNRRQE